MRYIIIYLPSALPATWSTLSWRSPDFLSQHPFPSQISNAGCVSTLLTSRLKQHTITISCVPLVWGVASITIIGPAHVEIHPTSYHRSHSRSHIRSGAETACHTAGKVRKVQHKNGNAALAHTCPPCMPKYSTTLTFQSYSTTALGRCINFLSDTHGDTNSLYFGTEGCSNYWTNG